MSTVPVDEPLLQSGCLLLIVNALAPASFLLVISFQSLLIRTVCLITFRVSRR